jgi:selenocysteine lyase/cysteine desulfurase
MSKAEADISRRNFLHRASVCATLASLVGREMAEALPSEWFQLQNPVEDEAYWRMVKRQFFIEDGLIYLNSGTYGPTLRAAYEAVNRNFQAQGQNYIMQFRRNYLGEAVPKFISKLAEFLGAKPDEIALTSGTTEAMNYIAGGLDLKPGDEILTTLHEHQGGIYPWLLKSRRFGVKVVQIPLKTAPDSTAEILEQFNYAITPRTRVLSFCHIHYTDGTVMPVRELCQLARDKGIISVVDGAQSVGMLDFKISELGCDFFAASFHKWMCAPYGTGLLYVREEMLNRHWPTVVLSFSGWDKVDRNGQPGVTDINYATNYPRALLKYSSNLEYYGNLYWTIAQSVDFHQLIGRRRIEARIKQLAARAREALREMPGVRLQSSSDKALHSGLVSFQPHKGKTSDLYFALVRDRQIVMRYIQHPAIHFDVNRLSTNLFNLQEDVDAAIAAIREKVS